MAQQNQNFSTIPDSSTKSEETDCNADSGFISSENIIYYSEDNIPSSSQHESQHKLESQNPQSSETLDSGIIDDKEPFMHLDSGICEVLRFENLSIGNDEGNDKLNNLNQPTRCNEASKRQTKTPVPERKTVYDIPYRFFQQNEDGDTTLHTAILKGHAELCSALIRIAPDPKLLDIANDDAQTPLHFAVETQQWQIVRQLIIAAANPCPRDIRGDSPLHIAARDGDLNCIKAILEEIKPQEFKDFSIRHPLLKYEMRSLDQWNYLGQTPVHVAAIHGHTDVLRQLVSYGADINAREGLSGFTPLHYAVQRRDEKMVHYLLKECHTIFPNARSYAGRTAWQTYPIVSEKMEKLFKTTGIESPYTSEDEGTSSDEEMYDPKVPTFVSNLVSSSA